VFMRVRSLLSRISVVVAVATLPGLAPAADPAKPATDPTFEQKIKPFLAKYCNSCHNKEKEAAGLSLEAYVSEAHARKDRKTWESVQHAMAAGEMPPKKKPQPTAAEKEFVIGWIENALTKVDCSVPKDPGRVTLRRLNRAEYNNTIRDLCGVDFQPADDFPSDDVGYGFDNIGDVLSVQPILLEKYLAAADKILDTAIVPPKRVEQFKSSLPANFFRGEPRQARVRNGGERVHFELTTPGAVAYQPKYSVPADGEYLFQVRCWGTPAGGEDPKLAFQVDDKTVHTTAVHFPAAKPGTVEFRIKLTKGDHKLGAALANAFADPNQNDPAKKFRRLGVEKFFLDGPLGGGVVPSPESTKKILPVTPTSPQTKYPAAQKVITEFARKAYRRPVKPQEVQRLLKLFQLADKAGEPFEQAIKLPLKAVLVSPNFLFLVEDDPPAGATVRTLNDHELAARLSYFLWSSMPDAELSSVADRGELRKPGVLKAQVERMIKDPKSVSLTENFAGQWLQLRSVRTMIPDPNTYPTWSEALRSAMVQESEMFFDHVIRTDRPILDFLDADYTFVNDKLARHYGIPNVNGPEFRRVKVTDNRRGGIVTQASVLSVTSNPNRTSPVKRGKWVLENVLGTPPPPPAPDVPEFPETGKLTGTLRQRFEQHRANPSCASCHAKLDPIGFALENFDGVGAWRDKDNGAKIDPAGVLPDGSKFAGPADLRKVLVGKADQFRKCFAEKLMTYALGRGVEYYDKCQLDDIVRKSKAGGDKFSVLALAVAESDAFQKRKGKRTE
jgi:hypothetical protein